MGVGTLIESLSAKLRQRQESAAEAYEALVAQVADDRAVKLETVEAVLQAAGKTPDDLRAGVEHIHTRRALEAIVGQEAALTAERDRISAAIEAEHARFRKANEEHAQTLWAMNVEQSELAPRLKELTDARARLFNYFPESAIVQRERAEQRAAAHATELSAARQRLDAAQRALERAEKQHRGYPRVVAAHAEDVKAAEAEVAAIEAAAPAAADAA